MKATKKTLYNAILHLKHSRESVKTIVKRYGLNRIKFYEFKKIYEIDKSIINKLVNEEKIEIELNGEVIETTNTRLILKYLKEKQC